MIVVDGRVFSIDAHDRGMGRYVRFLVQTIVSAGFDVCLILYKGSRLPKNDPLRSHCKKIKTIAIDPAVYHENDARKCTRAIEKIIEEAQGAAFIDATPFVLPVRLEITGCRVIAVAYDLIPLKYPKEYLPKQHSVTAKCYQNGLKRLIKADFIIAISHYSKDTVSNYLGIEKERIEVIYPCLEKEYFSASLPSIKTIDYFAILANHLAKHPKFAMELYDQLNVSKGRKYLLCAPTHSQLCALKSEFPRLTKRLELKSSISEQEKVLSQAQAKVAFHLSREEGFGIPLLEALFTHTRVVCCDIRINREILEKAGEGMNKISLFIALNADENNLSEIESFIDLPEAKENEQHFQCIKEYFLSHWEKEAPGVMRKAIGAASAGIGDASEAAGTRAMQYSKVIDYEDFYSEELAPYLQDVAHDPKNWQTAMALYSFEKHDLLKEGKVFAGIGAGAGALTEYLANKGAVVFSTNRDFDSKSENILPVHSDARALKLPSNFFDGVYSLGSMEHLGGMDAIEAAVVEIGRILKPGGVASISVEFKLDGPEQEDHGLFFTSDLLEKHVVKPSGLISLGIPNHLPSFKTFQTRRELSDFLHSAKKNPPNEHPHLVLFHEGFLFCSVHLLLKKPLDWKPSSDATAKVESFRKEIDRLKTVVSEHVPCMSTTQVKNSRVSKFLYRMESILKRKPLLKYCLVRPLCLFPGAVAYLRRKIKSY